VAGELILITEDGEHHVRNPGDTFVQKGTLHGWKNPGSTWTRWIAVIVDAETAKIDSEKLPDIL
jgi:quercetin dioxygenase-like cupin family protein